MLCEPAGSLGKSLIVALALAQGRTLTVPNLVDDVWSDNPPRQERAALQTLVSRVRATTAHGILQSSASGYSLGTERCDTDLGLASALAAEATTFLESDAAACERLTTRALSLWRDQPAAELGDTPLARELSARATALQADLRVIRARCRLQSGDAAGAEEDLERAAEVTPLDESIQLLRMRAADLDGRRNDAIRLFADFRAALRDELGTNPGRDIVRYHTQLLRDDNSDVILDRRAEPPRPSLLAVRRIGLRSAPNALVGRDHDIEDVEKLLAGSRLISILGPGGIGKTRLAQEIAHRATKGSSSVIFVELASVRSDDDVALALASTLGIREVRAAGSQVADPGNGIDLRSRILGSLAESETLLIIDNAEHIVDAAAAWVSDIVASTSSVRVLVTSRSPLAIAAEKIYQLDSLPSAPPEKSAGVQGPAVALFLERARAARPGAVLPLDTVARLCDRLDGLPLAIELAAARTRSMAVDEIERRLANRFALLTGGDRTAPERHRTLLAVIEWSWNLLGSAEQSLLRRLCRFPDGFSAAAAQYVSAPEFSGVVVDSLDALIAQSLVSVSEDPVTGILRYRMLETVREFGDLELERAGEVELVREGMFTWAAWFASEQFTGLSGSRQIPTIQRITAEQDNLIAILRAAIDGRHPDVVLRVFAVLAYYWSIRSAHSEVLAFGKPVMGVLADFEPEESEIEIASAAFSIIGVTLLYPDMRTAVRALSKLKKMTHIATIADDRLRAIVELVLTLNRPERLMSLLDGFRTSGNDSLACIANLISGQIEENNGDAQAALGFASTSYELAQSLDDTWAKASAAQALAQLHSQLAHPREALVWGERAQVLLRQLQSGPDLRQLDWLIGINAIRTDEIDRGRAILESFAAEDDEALGFDFLDLRAIGRSGLADLALHEGDTESGLRLWRDAVATFGPKASSPIPWRNVIAAGSIVAHIRAGTFDHEYLDTLARELRVRLIVLSRTRPGLVDKPVLGCALLGLAAWLRWTAQDSAARKTRLAASQCVEIAVEFAALAERLNSRQDMPTLTRSRFFDEQNRELGPERLTQARKRVGSLTLTQSAERAVTLLSGW